MGFCGQVCLLMWKNWLLQKRRLCVTFVELLLPTLVALIFVAFRGVVPHEKVEEPTFYQSSNIVPNFEIFSQNTIIVYTPKTPETTKLMNNLLQLLTRTPINHNNVSALGFQSENDAVNFHKLNRLQVPLVIVFKSTDSKDTVVSKNIMVTLRPDSNLQTFQTGSIFPAFQTGGPRGLSEKYKTVGILFTQLLIFEAFAHYWMMEAGNDSQSYFGVYEQCMAYPPHTNDPMIIVIQGQMPVLLILSFIVTVIANTKVLVYDKEKKLKESMNLMGVTSAAQWTSWFLTFSILLLPALVIYAMLFTLKVADSPVLFNTSGSVFFCFLACYGVALITFCFMISAFVQKANNAAVLAGIMYIVFYLPYTYVSNEPNLRKVTILTYCLSFNCAMCMGAKSLSILEGSGTGAQWNNFYYPSTVDEKISLFECMFIMLIDSLIHILITWYLDNIKPGEFGVPKPYFFFLTRSYWHVIPRSKYRSVEIEIKSNKYFEKDPTDLPSGIRICNLTKNFGVKPAVAGVTLNMYEGQITVLLGHNGAGKTTTMSVITGFIPPTSGTAFVNECDIRNNINGARKSLGLCPQHDILFDTLTVSEHLKFFAKLKGLSGHNLTEEVTAMIKVVDLESKTHSKSMNLSGGQKRKLSVGIALIGGSKVVILDEPSSGMDPTARRQMWSVLQDARKGRTILLTTHYMDEADLLGDRIAIMAAGVVKCCGSSMFLKKLYGTGYHLVIAKNYNCDINILTKYIQNVIAVAELETVVNTEVTYLLPDNQSSKFADLFRNLENDKVKLKITSFGTSATTMEEVFLRVGHMETDTHELESVKINEDIGNISRNDDDVESVLSYISIHNNKTPDSIAHEGNKSGNINESSSVTLEISTKASKKSQPAKKVNKASKESSNNLVRKISSVYDRTVIKKAGLSLELSRMYGILVKRAICTWRNCAVTIPQLLIPIAFGALILSAETSIDKKLEPPLTFDLSHFGSTFIPYTDGNNASFMETAVAKAYGKQIDDSHTAEYFTSQNEINFDVYTLSRASTISISTFNSKMIIGMEVIPATPPETIAAIAYYNGQPLHAQPIAVNFLLNAFLHYTLDASFNLQTAIYPLPENKFITDFNNDSGGSSFGSVVAFGMSFMTTLFVYFLIKEREVGSKHLQTISGIAPLTYWLPTYLWDYLTYLIATIPLLAVLAIYDKKDYLNDGIWAAILLTLVLYGWAVLGFMYTLQFAFKTAGSGVICGILFSTLSGMVTTMIVLILSMPHINSGATADNVHSLFMLLFPNYNFVTIFSNIDVNLKNMKDCKPFQELCKDKDTKSSCCQDTCGTRCVRFFTNIILFWETPGIASHLFYMGLQGFLYFLIIMVIEYRLIQIIWYLLPGDQIYGKNVIGASTEEDIDVVAEKERINSTQSSLLLSQDSLVLKNLYKRYRTFVAVDNICAGIPEQECFGLLGINGAGKTTTFKMLTGDEMITRGNAYMKGFDIKNNTRHVQSLMGYCPQFDALIPQMTCRETMVMYARLRGIPGGSINSVVNVLAESLMLEPHIDTLSGQCSGGNKRKLSTAVALIGNPPFIMLDEPSAGMDPEARRNLWTVLSQVRAAGGTLVLTSHSMEECEALCTRLAIMVNGRFKCLGSPQHLKNRFGQGYTLTVQLGVLEDGSTAPNEPVIEFIVSNFSGAKVFDDHQGYIHLQIPDATVKLADVFSVMETAKVTLNIRDYSVQQTTLEQIFLSFTREPSTARDVQNLLVDYVCSFFRKKQ